MFKSSLNNIVTNHMCCGGIIEISSFLTRCFGFESFEMKKIILKALHLKMNPAIHESEFNLASI